MFWGSSSVLRISESSSMTSSGLSHNASISVVLWRLLQLDYCCVFWGTNHNWLGQRLNDSVLVLFWISLEQEQPRFEPGAPGFEYDCYTTSFIYFTRVILGNATAFDKSYSQAEGTKTLSHFAWALNLQVTITLEGTHFINWTWIIPCSVEQWFLTFHVKFCWHFLLNFWSCQKWVIC